VPRAWRRCCLRSGRAAAAAGALLALCAAARAATLSSESSLGLEADYNSNPFLRNSGIQAAESEAVVANLPATYTSDTISYELIPRLRFAETQGVASLLSDYQDLDADWHLNQERNVLVFRGSWHRDSTFYNVFENSALNGTTLHRQEETANGSWQRLLSERSDFELIGSYDQVNYSHNPALVVVSYDYLQGSVQYDRKLTERWQWTTALGYGKYQLRDQAYRSDDEFAQTSLTHTLSELWSASLQVGYTRVTSLTQEQQLAIFEAPGGGFELGFETLKIGASEGTDSFAATVERKGERVLLDLAVSQVIQPSGLGALLTQDDASIAASMPWTERWTVGARLHGSRLSDPLQQISLSDRRYYDADLTASWLVTEHWTLQLSATYLLQRYSSGLPADASSSVALSLLRQLGHLRL
jgi:hypothetical protein